MKKNFLRISVSLLLASSLLNAGSLAAPSASKSADSISHTCTLSETDTCYSVQTESSAWTGDAATNFGSGLGTEQFPYIIKSGEELALLSKLINEGNEEYTGSFFALGANIDLAGAVWTPIGTDSSTPFSASFDGNGYTVSNFTLPLTQYSGLFGYIYNGTVKNLGIKNFEIKLSPASTDSSYYMYIGAVAGYVEAVRGNSSICGVSVSGASFDIDGYVKRVYSGGIVGYATSRSSATSTFSDCFTDCSITVKNTGGYNYVGGIAGQLHTGSSGLTAVINSYTLPALHSESYNTSRVGGIAGHIHSEGSAYAPVGSSLLADDVDIMISGCFSVCDIYSLSTKYYSRAGHITGDLNNMSDVENVYSPLELSTVTADTVSTTKAVEIEDSAADVTQEELKSDTFLSGTLGFDLDSVWAIDESTNSGYPHLIAVNTEKAALSGVDIEIGEKLSEDNVRYYELCGLRYSLPENAPAVINLVPSENMLISIIEKESEDSISTVSTKHFYINSESMTSLHLSGLDSHMDNSEKASIRTASPLSIRFKSQVKTLAKEECEKFVVEEYGFIIAVKDELDAAASQLNHDFDHYVSGVAYNRNDGTDVVFDASNDNLCVFTGILVNIPEKNYDTVVTSRNYTTVSLGEEKFTIYGEEVNASLYGVAKSLLESGTELDDGQKQVLENIIATVEA